MTLNQTKRFILGILQDWFTNKEVLDKFSLEEDELLFNNNSIVESFEEKDIVDTIEYLWPKEMAVNSLYSYCASIDTSGNYSKKIDNITYDIEAIITDIVDDSDITTIFNNISNDESKFLLLKANSINISKTLTPPYPKKSFIIFCPTIEGTGTISMTGKGPNVLPECILLFDETEMPETGRVLILDYANNQKNITNNDTTNDARTLRKGNDGTGYNCGSGGIGAIITNSGTIQGFMQSGSGYSYGGGAGTGNNVCNNSNNIVDTIYPMHGSDCILSYYYSGDGGVGNPSGKYGKGNRYGSDLPAQATGVGGRLIIFTNNCSISNLHAKGIKANDGIRGPAGDAFPAAGSSGGGSINIFYENTMSSICNVQGGEYSKSSIDPSSQRLMGGPGGNGTVVSIKCAKIKGLL